MPAVSPLRSPSPAELKELLAGLAGRAGAAQPPADDGTLIMSKNQDGSINVPDLGAQSGAQATGRFNYDIPLHHRELVPTLKQAIEGISKLTGTSISTDIKTAGFHAGDIPVTGVVRGESSSVFAAIDALKALGTQLD